MSTVTPDEELMIVEGEEGLFARDFEGRLIRMDKVTADDFARDVTVKIDGQTITVKKAVPATDEQGNIRRDEHGRAIPRADHDLRRRLELFKDRTMADVAWVGNPIPILCHRDYMEPVGVCRVCVVEISKMKRGKVQRERKLLPACQHRVEDTMEVQTIASPDPEARERVRSAVKMLTELLMADHPTPCAKEKTDRRLRAGGAGASARDRPAPASRGARPRKQDDSSLVIAVDHNACILCDRCVRGCNDIRDNQVIGRMGKGYNARIAFDLDAPMGASSCVACGECMVSCPTGALTHRAVVRADLEGCRPRARVGRGPGLIEHPIAEIRRAFQGVSRPFLDWNIASIVRRKFKTGEVICREGEYGATAFFIESGSVDIFLNSPPEHVETRPSADSAAWSGGSPAS